MDHLEKAKRQARHRMLAMQQAFKMHAENYNDFFASALVEPLLHEAALAAGFSRFQTGGDGYVLVEAKKAAELLSALPEDKASEMVRDKKEMPLTKKVLWGNALPGVLRGNGDSRLEIGMILLKSPAVSLNEQNALKECIKKCMSSFLAEYEVQNLIQILNKAGSSSNPTLVRSLFIAVAQHINPSDVPFMLRS